jgi:hypothetical protein
MSNHSPPTTADELHLLSILMIDADHVRTAQAAGLTGEVFADSSHRVLFDAIVKAVGEYGTSEAVAVLRALGEGSPFTAGQLVEIDDLVGTSTLLRTYLDSLLGAHARRKLIETVNRALQLAEDADTDPGEIVASLTRDLEHAGVTANADKALMAELAMRRIRPDSPPDEPVPRFYLAGKPIATPGNLVSLIARAKTGKTAMVGGMLASAVAASYGRTGLDTLGCTASSPQGKGLVLIDTEQSMFDAYECYRRALRRAEHDEGPPWLHAYGLAGYSAEKLRALLPVLLDSVRKAHGGIFAVMLDGVADFVADVNDLKECNPFVADLHALAIKHDAPVVCVIHCNEAQSAGDDARGHLGKQLTRKSESNLVLRKDGEVTSITSEKQRKAPITKEDGIAFRWSDEQARHVSCARVLTAKEQAALDELQDMALEAFRTDQKLRWTELHTRISENRKMGVNTIDRRITAMKRLGVIRGPEYGYYERVN